MAFERVEQQAFAVKVCAIIFLIAGVFNVVAGILVIVSAVALIAYANQNGLTVNPIFLPIIIVVSIIVFIKAILAIFAGVKGIHAAKHRDAGSANVFRILAIVICVMTLVNVVLGFVGYVDWQKYWWITDILFIIFAAWISHKYQHSLVHGEGISIIGGAPTVVVTTAYAPQPGYAPGYAQPGYSQPGYAPAPVYQPAPAYAQQPPAFGSDGKPQRY